MVDPVESTITLAKGFFTSWIFSIATTNYPHFKQSIHMAQNTVVHQFLSHQKTMCTTSSFSMRVTSRIWLFANSQRLTVARRTQLLPQIFFTTLPLCQFRRIHRRSQCYHPNSTWWWTRLRWWQLKASRKQPEEWMVLKVFLQSFIMHIREKIKTGKSSGHSFEQLHGDRPVSMRSDHRFPNFQSHQQQQHYRPKHSSISHAKDGQSQ